MTSPATQRAATAASQAADLLAQLPPAVRHVFALAQWQPSAGGPLLDPPQLARLLGAAYRAGTQSEDAALNLALHRVKNALDGLEAALNRGDAAALLAGVRRVHEAARSLDAAYAGPPATS